MKAKGSNPNKQGTKDNSIPIELDKTSTRLIEEIEQLPANPEAKQIAKQYRAGRIDNRTLQEVRDLLHDPNQMAKDHIKHFVKALGKGRFPSSSRNALHFLHALKRSGKEGQRAREIVKDLSKDESATLTGRSEKALLKELTDLRESDIIDETTSTTSSAVATTTTSADISARLRSSAETARDNIEMDSLPPEVIETLDRLQIRQAQIAKEANSLHSQLKTALKQSPPNEGEITQLQEKLRQLDEEFDQIAKQLEEPKQLERNFYARSIAKRQAVETFFRETGIDSKNARRIRMWMLALTQAGAKKPIIKLKSDPKTGKAQAKEETIQIIGMSFDPSTKEIEETSPGELNIRYKNEKGEIIEAGYQSFLNMLNAYEAYPEVNSLAELNEQIAENTHYLPIAAGDRFTLQSAEDQQEQFTITEVDESKQTISIDRTVKTLGRERLGLSVHPSLYFDRHKKTFNYGQFARFLAQNNCQRALTADELPQALSGLQAHQEKENEALKAGTSEPARKKLDRLLYTVADKFTPPTQGESRDIIWLDENGRQRFGRITQKADSNNFEIQPGALVEDPSIEDSTAELGNVVPLRFAAAPSAKTKLSPEQRDKYSNISPAELVNMVSNGQVTNLPQEQTANNQPKWSIDPNAELAVAAMKRSDKGTGDDNDGFDDGFDDGSGSPDSTKSSDDLLSEDGPRQGPPKQEGPKMPSKPKVYDEALPFDEINKIGGMTFKEEGYFEKLWAETRFLSVDDLWEMGKAMWEYYRRRFERRQKDRYSSIGKELPFFAPEMRRINQAAETEEVNQFKETFDQKGVYEIQERLQITRQQDEMKAAFTVLSEKGQLRWDDIDMWRNLNRFVSADKAIPIPRNGDPYTQLSASDKRTGFSFLQEAVDSLWGEGTYNDWYQRNKSSYASNAKNYYEEGSELEGVQGGHGRRLAELLKQHKNGEYVDPHEYEGLILHAIDCGKSSMTAKIYYLVEGVAFENKHGRTILSVDRMAHVNSAMLGKFPLLEYICASVPRPDGKGSHRWTKDDYKKWIRDYFDEGNPMNVSPGAGVDRFLWQKVLPSEQTKNRINKAFRNGEQIDHDDMYGYMPPATEQVITDATRSTTGSKKFFTVEGYANAFPGFSEYMRSLAEEGNKTRLTQAVKSYVRYEAIMRGRFEKQRWDEYQRLDTDTLRRKTIVTDTPPIAFITQLNETVARVVQAYDDPELNELWKWCQTETGDIHLDKNEMEKQKKVNAALKKFGDKFDQVARSDGGSKMVAVINGANLEGMPYGGMSEEELTARKIQFADEYNSM